MAEQCRVTHRSSRKNLSTSNSIIQADSREDSRIQVAHKAQARNILRLVSLSSCPRESLKNSALNEKHTLSQSVFILDLLSSGHMACHLHDNLWPDQSSVKTVREKKNKKRRKLLNLYKFGWCQWLKVSPGPLMTVAYRGPAFEQHILFETKIFNLTHQHNVNKIFIGNLYTICC